MFKFLNYLIFFLVYFFTVIEVKSESIRTEKTSRKKESKITQNNALDKLEYYHGDFSKLSLWKILSMLAGDTQTQTVNKESVQLLLKIWDDKNKNGRENFNGIEKISLIKKIWNDNDIINKAPLIYKECQIGLQNGSWVLPRYFLSRYLYKIHINKEDLEKQIVYYYEVQKTAFKQKILMEKLDSFFSFLPNQKNIFSDGSFSIDYTPFMKRAVVFCADEWLLKTYPHLVSKEDIQDISYAFYIQPIGVYMLLENQILAFLQVTEEELNDIFVALHPFDDPEIFNNNQKLEKYIQQSSNYSVLFNLKNKRIRELRKKNIKDFKNDPQLKEINNALVEINKKRQPYNVEKLYLILSKIFKSKNRKPLVMRLLDYNPIESIKPKLDN